MQSDSDNQPKQTISSKLLSFSEWENFFKKDPCVKHAFTWGIGCGALLFAHKSYLYKGQFRRAFNGGTLGAIVGSGIGFVFCGMERMQKYEYYRNMMASQNIKEAPGNSAIPKSD